MSTCDAAVLDELRNMRSIAVSQIGKRAGSDGFWTRDKRAGWDAGMRDIIDLFDIRIAQRGGVTS